MSRELTYASYTTDPLMVETSHAIKDEQSCREHLRRLEIGDYGEGDMVLWNISRCARILGDQSKSEKCLLVLAQSDEEFAATIAESMLITEHGHVELLQEGAGIKLSIREDKHVWKVVESLLELRESAAKQQNSFLYDYFDTTLLKIMRLHPVMLRLPDKHIRRFASSWGYDLSEAEMVFRALVEDNRLQKETRDYLLEQLQRIGKQSNNLHTKPAADDGVGGME